MRLHLRPHLSTRSTRHRLARLAAAAALPLAVLLPASTAHAHVTIAPEAAEAGSFAVVTFRVPNERPDASTTRLRVVLPEDQPVGSVRTTPVPGWRTTVDTRTLEEPIDLFGEQVSEVVAEVTWTATGDGVGPEEYQDFDLSLGPLPGSGEMVFTALQTYSSGEEVAWNEVSVDGTTEPESPAPVLEIVPPAEDAGESAEEPVDEASAAATDAEAASDDGPVGGVLPLVLSAVAVLLAGAALVVATRRRRA